jgi:uncharacterized protein (DUF983 family)
MSFSCPECQKPLLPFRASMGLKSKCVFCKTSLINKNANSSQLQLLILVALGTLLRYFLERYINEYIALSIAIIAIIMVVTIMTQVQKDDSYLF